MVMKVSHKSYMKQIDAIVKRAETETSKLPFHIQKYKDIYGEHFVEIKLVIEDYREQVELQKNESQL